MRQTYSKVIEDGRALVGIYHTRPGDFHGAFRVKCPTGAELHIIVGPGDRWEDEGMIGEPWDHVSVSLRGRTPTWEEMAWVKDQFFTEEECVMQLHPPKSRYINQHRHTLHLWRPWHTPIPQPPLQCV